MGEFIFFLATLFLLIKFIQFVYKKIEFPKWAKFNYSRSWGVPFFDKNKWIKKVLIKIFQFFVLIALLIILLIETSINLALKILSIKKIKI